MDVQKLVHSANQIGDFFQSYPDHDEAVEGIATHIRKFWEPRMRRLLLAHLDEQGGEGLHTLVRQALQERRASLTPANPA